MHFRFVILSVLCVASSVATASPLERPFSATAKELRTAASKAKATSGAPAIVLMDQATFDVDSRGVVSKSYHRVLKVNNRVGVEQWSQVRTSWAPWFQGRPTIRARVLNGASFTPLDPRTITNPPPKQGDDHTYSDYRRLNAPFPSVIPGSIIEYEIKIPGHRAFFEAGSVEGFVFGDSVPVERTRMVVRSSSKTLRYRARHLKGMKPTRRRKGGRTTWIFTYGRLEPNKYEALVPGEYLQSPGVNFTTGKSWRSVAEKYSQLVEAQLQSGPLPDVGLERGDRSRSEKIAAALEFLHKNVRYTGLEFGQNAIVPWTPAETWKRRYGDCKDKATLLVGILRRMGITAHLALLDSGRDPDVIPALPGMGSFDHAIVYVPGRKAIWIDATSDLARPGQLSEGVQGRLALVARKGTKKLVRIPREGARENADVESRTIRLSHFGEASLLEVNTLYGARELGLRYDSRGNDPKKTTERLKKYLKSEYGASEFGNVGHSDPEDLRSRFEYTLSATKVDTVFTGQDEVSVAVHPGGLLARLPSLLKNGKKEKARRYPIALVPHSKRFDYRILLPSGFEVAGLPRAERRSVGPVHYSLSFRQEKNEVRGQLELQVRAERVAVRDIPKLRALINELSESKDRTLNLKHRASRLAQQGKHAQAIGYLRSLVSSEPGVASHRARLAGLLVDVGLAGEARRVAVDAVSRFPSSVHAKQILAWSLQHNELGTRYGKGWAPKKAVAVYRQLNRQDPEDLFVVGHLANLLSRNSAGDLWEGDLRAALPHLKTLADKKYSDDSVVDYVTALSRLKNWKSLGAELGKARMKRTLVDGFKLYMRLARGGEKVLPDALRQMTSKGNEKQAAIAQAWALLMQSRYYAEFRALTGELNKLLPANNQIRRFIPTYMKIRKSRIASRPRTPEAAVHWFLDRSLRPGRDLKKLEKRAVWSKSYSERDAVVAKQLSASKVKTLPRIVMRDLAVATVEVKTTGRIAPFTRSVVKSDTENLVVYTTKEKGRVVFVASSSSPAGLGVAAQELIRIGKLKAAQGLLDWARAHTGNPSKLPFTSVAFSRVWTVGKRPSKRDTAWAAAILAGRVRPDASELKSCIASSNVPWAAACAEARYLGLPDRRWSDRVEAVRRIAKLVGSSPAADFMFGFALTRIGKNDEAEAIARRNMRQNASDTFARSLLATVLANRGEISKALAHHRESIEIGVEDGGEANMIAWLDLFTENHQEAITFAKKAAASKTGAQSSAVFHTLATVQAARGELRDAHLNVQKALGLAKSPGLRPHDYLVYGRIAAESGYPSLARSYYAKVKKDFVTPMPISSYSLAQRWAKKLKR